VNTTQSSEAFGCNARASEVGHRDLLRVADHDVLDLAFSIDEHSDLTPGLQRDLGHLTSELLRDDLCRGDAPRCQAFDAAKLIMFEALCKPGNAADKTEFLREEIISDGSRS
jgi:hypothetical protein